MEIKDIVASLPLELLTQIVEHLDLEDIIRCQRVCKRWRMIFSSDTFISPLLRETLAFLGLDAEGISTDVAMADAMSYFRWRHGLQHAQPIKKIFLPWPEHFTRMPDEVQCCSRRLCYKVPDRNEIEVLNLETGEIVNWTGSGGDSVCHFGVSDRYLVLASMKGRSYNLTAYDFQTNQKLSQRVSYSSDLLVVEGKVVIASLNQGFCPVYVWDLGLNHLQAIGNFSGLKFCHVAAAENILVAFQVYFERETPEVRQTKWTTTTGQLLEEKIFRLPVSVDIPVDANVRLLRSPCRTFGHKTVTQFHFGTDVYSTMHLEYDYAVDWLNVRLIHSVNPGDGTIVRDRPILVTPNLVYRWMRDNGQPVTYDATTGISIRYSSHLPDTRVLRPYYSMGGPIHEREYYWLLSVGDRDAFGLVGDGGVQLWFCNPKFVPDFLERARVSGEAHET